MFGLLILHDSFPSYLEFEAFFLFFEFIKYKAKMFFQNCNAQLTYNPV
jgi:hypothetical protein